MYKTLQTIIEKDKPKNNPDTKYLKNLYEKVISVFICKMTRIEKHNQVLTKYLENEGVTK